MLFNIVSLFPEFFESPLQTALMAKARNAGLVDFALHNPRDHGYGVHRSVDDRPYGGGPGMVLMLEPMLKTLRSITKPGRILVMSPIGKPFTQSLAEEIAKDTSVTLVCGRYEGFDARLAELLPIEYVSMGDMVLNGGEVPSLAMIEAISRLIPGFMGKEASGTEESFSTGLLEYPHYTRPEVFESKEVPAVLRSGDHGLIEKWRRAQSLRITLEQRPDLLHDAVLDEQDAQELYALSRTCVGRNLYIALVHHPVIIEGKNSGTSSLTNLDIHDIARLSRTYGLGGYYIVTPLKDQQEVLQGILHHWLEGAAKNSHRDRAEALSLVRCANDINEVVESIGIKTGQKPLIWGSSAKFVTSMPKLTGQALAKNPQSSPQNISFAGARKALEQKPALLLLGTGHGLAPEVMNNCDALLRPIRFLSDYNHLSVRAAVAIMVDRILQDAF